MSKRILAIVLISALALGTVFAAKGDIRVGLNVGFGHDEMRTSFPGESYLYYNNGLYVAADGSYEIADNVLLDLSAGIMTMGMCQLRINDEGTITTVVSDISTPANFSLYLGASYRFDISEEISVDAGAGFDMMTGGYMYSKENPMVEGRIGVGAEVSASYAVNRQINVILGGRYSVYFLNTDENIVKLLNETRYEDGGRVLQSDFKIFAGVTYAL